MQTSAPICGIRRDVTVKLKRRVILTKAQEVEAGDVLI